MRGLAVALMLALTLPTLAGCLTAAPTATAPTPAAGGQGKEALTTATHKLGKFISATVPSFDGTLLHVDIQLPDGDGKFPVMLTDTPYALLGEDAAGAQADAGRPFAGGYAPQYVTYGYAVAIAHVRGTGESGGCLTIGDPVEGKDGAAIVEWLANQSWSNGKVAMIGTSYDGTTPLETAVWQPPHLTTIVPISAVTEWYRYYFESGLHRRNGDPFPGSSDSDPVLWGVMGITPGARTGTSSGAEDARCIVDYTQQDDAQDDYSAYWHARDHHAKALNITIPVLYAQGWNDGNVATTGFPLLWANLTNSPEKRIWLEQHGHGVPATKKGYHEYVHRWLDYWLLGKDNGALALPNVVIEDNTGAFRTEATWPPENESLVTFNLSGANLARAPASAGSLSYRDDGSGSEDAALAGINHLVFTSESLAEPLHLAGAPMMRLKAATDMPDTQWDVKLYDLAPGDAGAVGKLITRGFLDAKHRESLDHTSELTAGKSYDFVFPLHPMDYRVAAGHKLILVVKSTDDYVVRSPFRATNTISFGPDASSLTLQVIDDATRVYADAPPAPWTS